MVDHLTPAEFPAPAPAEAPAPSESVTAAELPAPGAPVPAELSALAESLTQAELPARAQGPAVSLTVAEPPAPAPAESVAAAELPAPAKRRASAGAHTTAEAPADLPATAEVAAPAGLCDGPGVADGGTPVGSRARTGPGDPHAAGPAGGDGRFTLRLANFEGPFDLLLQLISRHKLDVTEVALSKVTDEFMAHIRAMGPDWDLDQTTEFLVVAATLLDLKAARLLPAAEVEDEADLALLEARDLLFARLLQYRAYKQIAEIFERRAEGEGRRYPRTVGLEPHHADLLPEVVISIGPEGFARLAVKAMQPKARPQVYVEHIHAPLVSVREQAGLVVRMLKTRGEATFQELTEDAEDTLTVVARFLALLELYREKAVALDQEEALQTLTVRWSGGDGDGMPAVTDEFDRIVEAKD
ncbi:segregation/condensation protein A [Streptomyces sp. NPDC056224]|uniref:segregation and condensation protein A n=1 Tax=Streptomyces sp. NPDC056224 TaxID=3345750 RepID=UPI0035E2739C